MKIIALLPVKNEAWVLPTYFSSVKKIADEIIALLDDSSDNSLEMLKKNSAIILSAKKSDKTDMSEKRKVLLEEGRKHGGTHFIWLDADETFSHDFISNGRERISKLKPGEKISM